VISGVEILTIAHAMRSAQTANALIQAGHLGGAIIMTTANLGLGVIGKKMLTPEPA